MSCVCACVCVCMCVSVFSPLSHFFTLPPLLSLSPSPLLQTDVWGQTKVVDKDLSKYPTALSFYLQPPQEEIGLEEFEELAVARLHCECVCVCLCDCVHCTSLSSARLFFLKRWNKKHVAFCDSRASRKRGTVHARHGLEENTHTSVSDIMVK